MRPITPWITTLATGLNFPESPAFDAAGRLWITELKGRRRTCLREDGLERITAGGNVNGLVFDAASDIWLPDSEMHTFQMLENFWDDLFPAEKNRLIHLLVESTTVREDGLDLILRTHGLSSLVKELTAPAGEAEGRATA